MMFCSNAIISNPRSNVDLSYDVTIRNGLSHILISLFEDKVHFDANFLTLISTLKLGFGVNEKIKLGNDQEKAQSERNFHSKNRWHNRNLDNISQAE